MYNNSDKHTQKMQTIAMFLDNGTIIIPQFTMVIPYFLNMNKDNAMLTGNAPLCFWICFKIKPCFRYL